MKTKRVVAVVIVVAVALATLLFARQHGVPPANDREVSADGAGSREGLPAGDSAPTPPRLLATQEPIAEPEGPPTPAEGHAIHVVGIVRDREGRPIQGADVLAHMQPGTACTTDAGGAFRLPSGISAGTPLVLRVGCPRYLATQVNVVARANSPVVVELDRAPRISGTLVDPRGEPIEGYRLQALSDAGKPLAFGITGPAGKFDLCRKDAGSDGYATVSEMYTYGHGMLVDRLRVAWGTEDLELHAQSSGELELRVTRGGEGTPVTAFAVCLLHAEHQGPQGWNPRSPVRVASDDGVARLRCIPGPVSAIVVPNDVDLQPSTMVAVHVPENGTTVATVTLLPGPVQRVRVIDRQTGLGVAGALLRIVVGGSDAERRSDATLPGVAEAQGIRMLTWPRTGVIAKATTDANGAATMRAATPAAEASIECEHPDYQPANARLTAGAEPFDREIALDSAMLIRGVVEPEGILRFRPYLRTCHARGGKEVLGKWVLADQRTGSFELVVAANGEVRLDLALPSAGIGPGVFGPVVNATGIARIAEGTPAARGEQFVVVDASAYVPGSAVGTVFVDGGAPSQVRLHRVSDGVANPGIAGEVLVRPDGTFVVEPLLVGEWLFSAAPMTDDMKFQYLPVFFAGGTLRPGDRMHIAGNLTTITTEMTVRDSAGTPLSEGQDMTLALQRCPLRRYPKKLEAGGVLRVPGVVTTETVLVRVVGGPLDKQTGEAAATAPQVTVR